MGLRICTARSMNGSHTIRRKLKFVSSLYKLEGNWVLQEAPDVLCLPQIRGKLINHMPTTNYSQTIWFACVYRP